VVAASEVAAYRGAVNDLTTLAVSDLAAALRALEGDSPERVRNTLIRAFPGLVRPYLTAASELSATWYEDVRAQVTPAPFYAVAPAVAPSASRVGALVRWGVAPLFGLSDSTPLSLIGGGMQRLVAGAGRDTIDANAIKDSRSGRFAATGWSRIAQSDACEFCTMLAGRGARYRSEGSAGGDSDYHDWCRCVAVPAFFEAGPGGQLFDLAA
jgi:hypothetical protein